jgi:haloalkane dehalogenase
MHYVDEGAGTPLLLCHGNPMWSFLYRKIIAALRDRFRCIAADLHGFGLSERPDKGYGYTAEEHVRTLGELVDHLDLTDFVVMGQDWGGPTGLGVAIERHDRVRGVVLGNTWFFRPQFSRSFSLVASSPPLQWAILRRNLFIEGFVPRAMTSRLTDDEMNHYRLVQPNPSARVGIAAFPTEIRESPLLPRLEREVPTRLGDKPTLIAWGMKDWSFRASHIARVRSAFRDHHYVELSRAGHYIQEDAAPEIAAAITARFAS